jgi:hypothetical protein
MGLSRELARIHVPSLIRKLIGRFKTGNPAVAGRAVSIKPKFQKNKDG